MSIRKKAVRKARTIAIGISVPSELLPLIDMLAAREGRSRSSYISYVLANALRTGRRKPQKLLDLSV